jgi:preprotein translocase subunit SecG
MAVAFQIASIALSVLLIGLIMMQVRGGSLGSLMGGDAGGGGIARTRRGLEKTLFQITVSLAIIFMIICIFSAIYYS